MAPAMKWTQETLLTLETKEPTPKDVESLTAGDCHLTSSLLLPLLLFVPL